MNPPPGIEQLPNGQWVVEGDSHFAVWAKQRGNIITDPGLMRWLKPHLEGVKVAYDLGANIGDHTRAYLDMGMQVVAIEPNPLPFQCLQKNCPTARCLQVAASDTAGVATFAQSENVGASRIAPGGGMQVITVALDSLDLPDPGYVKLDVEGYEVFALRGMIETLKRCKPIIFCEVNRGALAANGHTPEDITSLLRDYLGYTKFSYYPPNAEWSDPQFDLLCTI